MGKDMNYEKILIELKEIHELFPDLRFGHVVQAALDRAKNTRNLDFHDLNSKRILAALIKFKEHIISKKNR